MSLFNSDARPVPVDPAGYPVTRKPMNPAAFEALSDWFKERHRISTDAAKRILSDRNALDLPEQDWRAWLRQSYTTDAIVTEWFAFLREFEPVAVQP